jgi:hypothetical protein
MAKRAALVIQTARRGQLARRQYKVMQRKAQALLAEKVKHLKAVEERALRAEAALEQAHKVCMRDYMGLCASIVYVTLVLLRRRYVSLNCIFNFDPLA